MRGNYDVGKHYVYGKALKRLAVATGETEERLDVILGTFFAMAKEGLVAPKRFFPIPAFGAFWRVDGEVEFCAEESAWPDLGADLGIPADPWPADSGEDEDGEEDR